MYLSNICIADQLTKGFQHFVRSQFLGAPDVIQMDLYYLRLIQCYGMLHLESFNICCFWVLQETAITSGKYLVNKLNID